MSFVGEPGSGEKKFHKKEYLKLKSDTKLVVRILPPLGKLAAKGVWNRYYAVHFGYRGTDERMLIFQSTLETDRETRVVTQEDPALNIINNLKDTEKRLKEALPSLSGNKLSLATDKLKETQSLLKRYNVDKKYHMNVIDLNGTIYDLQLGYKDFNQLKALRKELQSEEGIDIVSVKDGIFVEMSKSGRGLDTVTSMKAYQEVTVDADGKRSRDFKKLPITPDLFPKLEREAHDLDSLYPLVTVEQIQDMVDNGAVAVDRVRKSLFGERNSVKPQETSSNVEEEEESIDLDDILSESKSETKVESAPEVKAAAEEESENSDSSDSDVDDLLEGLGIAF